MLTNPYSAGALVYGRTAAKTVVEDGRARHTTRQQKPREPWRVLLLENHPGYISWEEFVQHQQTLEANCRMSHAGAGGAAKRGPALLSGLLRCGRCDISPGQRGASLRHEPVALEHGAGDDRFRVAGAAKVRTDR